MTPTDRLAMRLMAVARLETQGSVDATGSPQAAWDAATADDKRLYRRLAAVALMWVANETGDDRK